MLFVRCLAGTRRRRIWPAHWTTTLPISIWEFGWRQRRRGGPAMGHASPNGDRNSMATPERLRLLEAAAGHMCRYVRSSIERQGLNPRPGRCRIDERTPKGW
jgi:hypothetical protein